MGKEVQRICCKLSDSYFELKQDQKEKITRLQVLFPQNKWEPKFTEIASDSYSHNPAESFNTVKQLPIRF